MEYSQLTRLRMSEAKKLFFKNGGRPHNYQGLKRACETCGKDFPIIKSRLKTARFCSISCGKGKHFFGEGHKPWNKGKSHLRGEKHWNWKGGIDKEHTRIKQTQEYKDWRAEVYKRDRWQCKKCGAKKLIVAHHKKPFSLFPKLRFTVSNGVALCRKCHQDIHRPRRADYKSSPIFHA